MGMPVTIEVADATVKKEDMENVFSYFVSVDDRFSTYKDTSEISKINHGDIKKNNYSEEMKEVLDIAAKTQEETNGYFNIKTPDGLLDPSGIVKGWAIYNALRLLTNMGYKNFYVDAGGDIQARGKNSKNEEWTVGIRNPFNRNEIIKIIYPKNAGVATSGIYIRGQHIYDPYEPSKKLSDIVSLTVIGPNILEADRFATACFAMGRNGINFIQKLDGFEGYAIDSNGIATMTTWFEPYTLK